MARGAGERWTLGGGFCPLPPNGLVMKVGIVAQWGNDRAAELASDLRERLTDEGAEVWLDEATAEALDARGEMPDGTGVPPARMSDRDLVVSIGGDGTFLFVAREASTPPILGVNLGEVGFLNAVSPDDAVEAVTREVERYREHGEVQARAVDRLAVTGDGVELPLALNEILVQGGRRGPGDGIEYAVRLDGVTYAEDHADGVLVATPTGSTAYNLSEGGPLVYPDVDALIVTEMVAREPMPPLVAPMDAEITIEVDGGNEAYAVSDGRSRSRLELPATLTVSRADQPVRIAGPEVNFFEALEKLD